MLTNKIAVIVYDTRDDIQESEEQLIHVTSSRSTQIVMSF